MNTKNQPGAHERRISPLTILVVAILVAAVLYTVHRVRAPRSPGPEAPAAENIVAIRDPDLTGAEPQVAEKIRKVRSNLEQDRSSAGAWGMLGINLHVHDFKKESIPCYRQASTLAPSEFRWVYYGAIAMQETQSPDALGWFERAAKLKPDHAPLHVRYGDALLAAGRTEDARREYDGALSRDASLSHALLGLARIELDAGNVNEARSKLEQAVAVRPQHAEVRGLLGEVYRRLNETERAQFEMQASQRLPKDSPLPDSLLGDWAAEGVSSTWHDLRGRAYLQSGDIPAAIRELELAVQVAGKNAGYHDTLGVAYMYAQNYPSAVRHHRIALELNPGSVEAKNNLAAALFEMGGREEAIRIVRDAIREHPSAPHSYVHLSNLLLRSERPAEAIRALEDGHRQLPENARITLQLAGMLAMAKPPLRNGAQAVSLAESVCGKSGCRDAESLYLLAAAYSSAGRSGEAREKARDARAAAEKSGNKQVLQQIEALLKNLN